MNDTMRKRFTDWCEAELFSPAVIRATAILNRFCDLHLAGLFRTLDLPALLAEPRTNSELARRLRFVDTADITLQLSTTITVQGQYLLDYGYLYGDGTATHHLTLYRHASGALVFSAGTLRWSMGLDTSTPDAAMQQGTVNILADMGVQPATPLPGIVPATLSTDSSPPTSTISSPADGSSVTLSTPATITGTAADFGNGAVGAVEVSVDGGITWHPASGRENWTYIWVPQALGTATIMSRAVDDSGNLEAHHRV